MKLLRCFQNNALHLKVDYLYKLETQFSMSCLIVCLKQYQLNANMMNFLVYYRNKAWVLLFQFTNN